MFSIIQMIEDFEDSVYLRNLLPELDKVFQKSPKWAIILVMLILNSTYSREELVRIISTTSNSTKGTLKQIFETLKNKDPKWINLTENILL